MCLILSFFLPRLVNSYKFTSLPASLTTMKGTQCDNLYVKRGQDRGRNKGNGGFENTLDI